MKGDSPEASESLWRTASWKVHKAPRSESARGWRREPPDVLTSPSIVLLSPAWPSSHGGIETVNRELGKALARLGEVVVCIVAHATAADVADAAKSEVQLIKGKFRRSDTNNSHLVDVAWPTSPPTGRVRLIIGHSKFTGRAANALRDRLNAQSGLRTAVRSAYFVHMDLRALRSLEGLPAAQRDKEESTELEGLRSADLVLAMGPKLRDVAADLCRQIAKTSDVTMIVGGMDPGANLLEPRHVPAIALIGRLALYSDDPMELRLNEAKGVDLVLDAYGELLKTWSPHDQPPALELIGIQPELEEPLVKAAHDRVMTIAGRRHVPVNVTPFASNISSVETAFSRASLLLMPSVVEGYGLVALEALSRGIPVLVSAHSGVAQLIRDRLPASLVSKAGCFIDTEREDAAVALADQMAEAIRHPLDTMHRQMDLRRELMMVASWEAGAEAILKGLNDPSGVLAEIRQCRQWLRSILAPARRLFFPSHEHWEKYRKLGQIITESPGMDRADLQDLMDCFGYFGKIAAQEGRYHQKGEIDRVTVEGVDLSRLTLDGVFIDTDFRLTDLRGVIAKAGFFYCSWDEVSADDASLHDSLFELCRWRAVTLRGASLLGTRFKYFACDGLAMTDTALDNSFWETARFSRVSMANTFGSPVWEGVTLLEIANSRPLSSFFDQSLIWDGSRPTPLPSSWVRKRAKVGPYEENFSPGRFGRSPDSGIDLIPN